MPESAKSPEVERTNDDDVDDETAHQPAEAGKVERRGQTLPRPAGLVHFGPGARLQKGLERGAGEGGIEVGAGHARCPIETAETQGLRGRGRGRAIRGQEFPIAHELLDQHEHAAVARVELERLALLCRERRQRRRDDDGVRGIPAPPPIGRLANATALRDTILFGPAEADPALGRLAHGLLRAQESHHRSGSLDQLARIPFEHPARSIENGDLDRIAGSAEDRDIDEAALARSEAHLDTDAVHRARLLRRPRLASPGADVSDELDGL